MCTSAWRVPATACAKVMGTSGRRPRRAQIPAAKCAYGDLSALQRGYLSANTELAIRRELCEEAIRLATLLAEHTVGAVPETFALVALMHLHTARLSARSDRAGGLLLLEEQDRSLWDRERIGLGAEWLKRAASGEVFSRFHAEAGIAAEHCFAPSFAETRWAEISDLYAMLERVAPSPLNIMNQAVAIAEWKGPDEALKLLQDLGSA